MSKDVYNKYGILYADDTMEKVVSNNIYNAISTAKGKTNDIILIKVEEKDITFTKTEPQFINFNVISENGNVYPSSGELPRNSSLILTAIPNEDYEFIEFRCGEDIYTDNPLTLEDIKDDLEIETIFEQIEKEINIIKAYNEELGSVESTLENGIASFVIAPNDDCRISKVIVKMGESTEIYTEFESEIFEFSMEATDDILITVQFSKQVLYKLVDNETVIIDTFVDEGTIKVLPVLDNTTELEFVGWIDSENNEYQPNTELIVNSDIVLTAVWKVMYVTISYESEIPLVKTVDIVEYGKPFVLPIPQDNGVNHFIGWKIDNADEEDTISIITPISDITLIAQWEQKVSITYETNVESLSENLPQNRREDIDTVLILDDLVDESNEYTFDGWYVDNEKVTEVRLTTNITILAKWLKNYTVNYITNIPELEESINKSEVVTERTTIELNFISLDTDEYNFLGWYVDEQKIEENEYIITDNITFKAIFE